MSLLNVDETEIQKGACDGPQTSLKVHITILLL